MAVHTAFMERFGLRHPVVQAPLAGGGDTPELVAAVCEAGGMGFIGAGYLTPSQIADAARAVRARTTRPFGINIFAPVSAPPTTPGDAAAALARLAPYYVELGIPLPAPRPVADTFDDQLAAALDSGASAFSFTFGLLPPSAMNQLKGRMFLIGTATTVDEAILLERSGVDAVVAQGSEAGGHRGSFAADFQTGMIGTMALVPQIVDAVGVLVLASGGVMDGRGIAAALALGAGAVQMGTAFLTCDEAGAVDAYKEAILHAHEDGTRLTRAFSGRPARGIINRFMVEVERGAADDAILEFPGQNAITRPLRTEAARQGRAEFLSLWAGQGMRLARRQPAADLVERLGREADAAIRRLAGANSGSAAPRANETSDHEETKGPKITKEL